MLTERQIYLANKRKFWIDNTRKTELLKLQVEQLDREELLASKQHDEMLTVYRRRSAKVEDWLGRNSKVANRHDKTKDKCKVGQNYKTKIVKGKTNKVQLEAKKMPKDNKVMTKHDTKTHKGQKDNERRTNTQRQCSADQYNDSDKCKHNQEITMGEHASVNADQTSASVNAKQMQAINNDIAEININKIIPCSNTGTRNMSSSKFSQSARSLDEDSDSRGSRGSNDTKRSKKSTAGSRVTMSSRTSTASRARAFYGQDSDDESTTVRDDMESLGKSSTIFTSVSHTKSKKKKLKSGMYDKPNQDIVTKLKWPHNSLDYTYRSKVMEFNKITFNQYIAGESKIIALCDDSEEVQGRLRLMNKITYVMDDTGDWEHCREYFAAVMVSIELGRRIGDPPSLDLNT